MNRLTACVSLLALAISLILLAGCSNNSSSSSYSLLLEPNGLTVIAGQQVQLSPTVLQNGAPVANPVVTWSITPEIGTITQAGLFTAVGQVSSAASKKGTITVRGYGKKAVIPVTVTIGPLASLEIIVPNGVDLQNVRVGDSIAFSAVGEDALGNRGSSRIAVTPSWSVQGGIGTISADGLFQATSAGSGTIVATVAGIPPASVDVRVVTGPIDHLIISISIPEDYDTNHMVVGDEVDFRVIGVDQDGNGAPVNGVWSVQGSIGTITPQGHFTATAIGDGAVRVTYQSLQATLPVHVVKAFRGAIAYVQSNTHANLAAIDGLLQITPLTTGNNHFDDPVWTPDGANIVFMSQGSPLNGVCIIPALGGAATSIYSSRGFDPVVSPDGNSVAFANGEVAAGEIDLISKSGVFIRKIATGATGNPRSPTWSPDGQKIAFTLDTLLPLTRGVYLVNADGTGDTKRIYTQSAKYVRCSPVSPYFAVADDHRIVIIPASGGAGEEVLNLAGTLQGGFAWSPDGKAIVYGVKEGTRTQLYVKYLSPGVTVKLTSATGFSSLDPAWKE